MDMLTGLILAALVLLPASLLPAYAHLPVKELKQRTKEEDSVAAELHKAAVYGFSLQILLWFLVVLASGWFFVFVATHYSSWTAVAVCGLVVVLAFAWLPNRQPGGISIWLAKTLAPVLAWLLQFLHPPLDWLHQQIIKYRPSHQPTQLFDRADLLNLINHQNEQAGNRVPEAELEIAFNALSFGDKLVSDHLTPRRSVKAVSVDADIGPILMAELHSSGATRFPVYEGKKDNIVGTLFLKDLVDTKASATVKSVMRKRVYYVHEDQTLGDVLQAIMRTHHHLYVVVNDQEEYVGVITIEAILEQVVGRAVVDEFDQYDDARAVAKRAAHRQLKAEPETSEPQTEVVELDQ